MSKSDIEIYEREPEDFVAKVQVAACCIEIDGKLLLLQQASGKVEPGKWGVPAGKLEENETPQNAAKRELFEETGIAIENLSQMQPVAPLYIRKPEISYIFHLFKIHLDRAPDVRLSDEHQDYTWATTKDLQELPLMAGAREALQMYRTTSK